MKFHPGFTRPVVPVLVRRLTFVGKRTTLHLVLRPRHLVTFRHADGRRRLLCFRFRKRAKRLEFMKHLEANIKTARPAVGG